MKSINLTNDRSVSGSVKLENNLIEAKVTVVDEELRARIRQELGDDEANKYNGYEMPFALIPVRGPGGQIEYVRMDLDDEYRHDGTPPRYGTTREYDIHRELIGLAERLGPQGREVSFVLLKEQGVALGVQITDDLVGWLQPPGGDYRVFVPDAPR